MLVFPIPTFIVLSLFEDISILEVLQLDKLNFINPVLGLLYGFAYAFFAIQLLQTSYFDKLPRTIERTIQQMNLRLFDYFFLSLCAGVGEELLFRAGVQFYLGPIVTSILFVAIHGYLNPMNLKMSLYGLVVLPFIIGISYAFIDYGIWFCIAAHFAYDFLVFISIEKQETI